MLAWKYVFNDEENRVKMSLKKWVRLIRATLNNIHSFGIFTIDRALLFL